MKKTISLSAQSRSVLGHKVKSVRRQGLIPGTLYGKTIESISLAIPEETLITVLKQAGETQLIELTLDTKTYPVLVHAIQRHPVSQKIVHIEFFNVNLKEKLKTQVPVEVVGEAPAVKEGKGTLLSILSEVEIEALPSNIPEALQIEVTTLTEVEMELKVKDLKIPADVTIITDAELTVVKIVAQVIEEVVAPTAEVAPTEGTAATPTAEAATDEEVAE